MPRQSRNTLRGQQNAIAATSMVQQDNVNVALHHQDELVEDNENDSNSINSIDNESDGPPSLRSMSHSSDGDNMSLEEEGEIAEEDNPVNYPETAEYAAAQAAKVAAAATTTPTTTIIRSVNTQIDRITNLIKDLPKNINKVSEQILKMEIELGKDQVKNLSHETIFTKSVLAILPRTFTDNRGENNHVLKKKLQATGFTDWKQLSAKDLVEVVKQSLSTSDSTKDFKNKVLDAVSTLKITSNFPQPNQLWGMEQKINEVIADNLGENFNSHPSYTPNFQKQLVKAILSKGMGENELAHRLNLIGKREEPSIITSAKPLDAFFNLENQLMKQVEDAFKLISDTYPSVYSKIKALIDRPTEDKLNANPNQSSAKGKKRDREGQPIVSSKQNTNGNTNDQLRKLCNICGHSHVDGNVRCFWFTHPNKNSEYKTIDFPNSKAGKAYKAKFDKTVLTTDCIDGSTFDLKAARDKLKKPKGNCKSTCNCNTCIVSNNSSFISNDNAQQHLLSTSTNPYLLSSIIKVSNTNIPIECFLDTGTLGHGKEANFISEKVFNLIKNQDKNIKINNKHIKICSDIIPTCIDALLSSSIKFCFNNDVNNKTEVITIPVFILTNATYDLLIGRETIHKHKLLTKLTNHFNGEFVESSSATVPVAESSKANMRRHESHASVNSSSYSDKVSPQRLGELILKKDLLDDEFREIIDDEIDEYELPAISDVFKDETHLITILGSEYLKQELAKLVKEFSDVFSTTVPSTPSKLNPLILEVDKTKWCVKANQGPPRLQSFQKEQEIIKQIEKYLELNVITKSNANYYSQILMVPKPENHWRFCLDLRNLNKATKPMGSVLPSIQQMLIRIGMKKPKHFSKFDLTSGYFQCSLAEGSKDFTSFTSSIGIYRWNRVTMGLMNAAGHYHNEIANNVLAGLMYNTVELYIDDIFIPSSGSEDNHLEDVRDVLKRFRKFGIKVNPTKTILGDNNAVFCGHKCSEEGISFDRNKLNLVEDFPDPIIHEDLKRFVGLANYFRDHIKDHSILADPLNKVLSNYDKKKKLPIIWSPELLNVYNQLKRAILNCPQLFYIKEGKQYLLILECDASDKRGLGGYLKQVEFDHNRNIINEFPIAFVSKGWTNAEINWAIPEKEAFAIYYCMKKLSYILNDVYFIVRTDHKNITYLNFENNQKVKRWKMNVQTFNFDVEFIRGDDNIVADTWSRVPALKKYTTFTINTVRLEDDMSSDYIDINTAYRYSSNPIPVSLYHDGVVWSNSLKIQCNAISLNNNNVILNNDDDSDEDDNHHNIKIPQKYFNDLVQVHNHNVGHTSIELTYNRLINLHKSKWLNKKSYVIKFCKHCPFCLKMKEIKPKIHSSPFVLSTYNMFERVAFDTIGPLNETEDNSKYILVMICTFSRWVHLFALKRLLAKEAAEKIIQYIGIYGSPKQFLSDRGTQFKNETFSELNRLLGIDHQFSTAYSSEENGIVERVNKEVMNKLRSFIFHKKFLYNWNTTDLPLVQRLINSKIHSRLGTSPASLVMPAVNLDRNIIVNVNNRRVNLDGKININNRIPDDEIDFHYLAKNIQQRYIELQSLAKETLLIHDNQHINDYPTTRTSYPTNSYVLVSFKSKNHPQKANTRLRGPLKVLNQTALNSFQLKNLVNGRIETYNRQDLIPFEIDISQYDPAQIALSDHLGLLEIESVLSHKPARPKKVTDLSFVVKWVGYDDEKDLTTEHWSTNETLKKNRVILRYLRDKGFKKFIPRNIEIDKEDFSSDED